MVVGEPRAPGHPRGLFALVRRACLCDAPRQNERRKSRRVSFPNGSNEEFLEGSSLFDLAESISPRLVAAVVIAGVNEKIKIFDPPTHQPTSLTNPPEQRIQNVSA